MKYKSMKFAAALLFGVALSTSSICPPLALMASGETQLQQAEDLRALVNPVLQEYTASEQSGTWMMNEAVMLAIAAEDENIGNEKLAGFVRLISSEMKEKGLTEDFIPVRYLPVQSASSSAILIDLADSVTEQSSSPEAYRIEIGADGVHLIGASEEAVLNGLHTIENLLITNGGLPYGTIVDYPNVAERRIHVDCARKYISKDWFIRLIHEMSWMKLNALQIHFSENLGFRIECETDPSIVSDQYLTKAEVREILAEASKYGINVIPSFDSPGHVDQILKAHPEYGQVSSNGSHYASGLDVTNPEAVEYIRSLYAEYCELFKGCTDFHIGGDEYMEFDRAPFTTIYKSVLDAYAVEKYGAGYTWKDTISGYINELAEFVHDKGFTPRIWNDGIYYGHSSSTGRQKIVMHDYIGIDFWSQMGWNPSIAKLSAFVEMGHKKLYNINSSYFYYVLRGSKPTDGREQHSFDNLNADQLIYNEWTPGKFSANTLDDNSELIAGSAIGIWCDYPDLVEEDVIQEDIAKEMRALASKSWNTASPSILAYSDFVTMHTELGHAGAWNKGSKLEEAPEVLPSEDLGQVEVHYVDSDGNEVLPKRTYYGSIGENYRIEPADVYEYRCVNPAASGTYAKDGAVITFTYELYTDWSRLETLAASLYVKEAMLPDSWTAYDKALKDAKALLDDHTARQGEVDAAADALQEAIDQIVPIEKFVLRSETKNPLPSSRYVSGYEAYQAALDQAQLVLDKDDASLQESADAAKAIIDARKELVPVSDQVPAVTATKAPYSTYAYSRMFDKDPSTFAWFDGAQEAGQLITFTFDDPVVLSAIRVRSPLGDSELDYIRSADVETTADGTTWSKVGEYHGESRDMTVSFDRQTVKAIRLKITEDAEYWVKITEVDFTIHEDENSSALKNIIEQGYGFDPSLYTYDSFAPLILALDAGQEVLINHSSNEQAAVQAIQEAIDALVLKNRTVDLALLELTVSKARAIQSNSEAYLKISPDELSAALREAESLLLTGNDQNEINRQTEALHSILLAQRRTPDSDDSILK